MPCPTKARMTEKPSASTRFWTAAEMSETRPPSFIAATPARNDSRAVAMSRAAAGSISPTGTVTRRVAVEALEQDPVVQADDVALAQDPSRTGCRGRSPR